MPEEKKLAWEIYVEPLLWKFKTREQARVAKQMLTNIINFLNEVAETKPTKPELLDKIYSYKSSIEDKYFKV